ncbi:cytochrome ubiquinol oxidase subunit I [Pseudonocardia eucalypti]|uniref:Cytochrome ubiquinol oxidase subunit I n=1 Tax=Pseudonocardia eucalypti TaxID=648755 RepID=A0ABP9QSG5_9PSEU|nr:cytochrome d ubiquinol oxidase subunit I [Pseudonocardia eucalypti]
MIDDLTAAREQMALSLSFHIVFAVLGVGMPWLMLAAEWRGLRTGDARWTALARRWSKAVAVLFAVGAVSGTVLSIEFGLLWPTFMERFGAAIGLSFTLESFAFFIEAIFLALYLYGWERLSPTVHLLCAVPVALGGMASALFVTTANAWMNGPVGLITGPDGRLVATEPLGPFLASTAAPQLAHMGLAALLCTGLAVAAVYAVAMLRDPAKRDGYHRRGLAAGATLGLVTAPLQVLVGDWATRAVAEYQPAKFAAMEGVTRTQDGAPFHAGPFEIPRLLSVLLYFDPNARVVGMDAIPPPDRPPAAITHLSFQVMVGIGTALLALAAWAAWLYWRHYRRGAAHPGTRRGFLLAMALAGPAPFVALLAGWIVTEVGRQPWIVYRVMRTPEALTTQTGLATYLYATIAVYLALSVGLVAILRRIARGPTPADPAPARAEEVPA